MSDTIILLHGAEPAALSQEVRSYELLRSLEALTTSSGKNYAVYSDPDFTPDGDIVILPFPSIPPEGASKICEGKLTVAGSTMKVTVYRLG